MERHGAVPALDREGQPVARIRANDPLHVGETVDPGASDIDDDVADLEARGRGRAAGLDHVDPRGRARLAVKGEQTGENHDGEDEICDRTGGNDRLWDKLTDRTYGAYDFLKILSSYPGLKYTRDNRWNYDRADANPSVRRRWLGEHHQTVKMTR